MIERYYEDAPEQFKTAWLNENNAKGIIIKFIDYKRKVYPAQNDNPKALGWYEHDDKAKKYIKTTDTTVIENKRYFEEVTNNSEILTYTDQTIENDSFKLKRSLQSGSTIDFMGCISSSLEFKVENDFKYLKDQKLYAELTVTVLAGTQIITGPLGVFKVGTNGRLPAGWSSNNISYRNEINELGTYQTRFFIIGDESHPVYANEYLERCHDNDNRGLEARIEIPQSINDTLWKIRVFTGIVEEIKRDKSRDIVRTITAYDFLHRLLDNYDVTDWYVWQYGEEPKNEDGETQTQTEETEPLKHPIYDLRNSFWNFIANEGPEYSPTGQEIQKKNEGWDQVQNTSLVNDNIWIPKTLNINPVDYDNWVGGELIGGPFEKGKPADIQNTGNPDNYWDITDRFARDQVIDIGVNTGAIFKYNWSVAKPDGTEDPMLLGWYEIDYYETNKTSNQDPTTGKPYQTKYMLSQDTTVINPTDGLIGLPAYAKVDLQDYEARNPATGEIMYTVYPTTQNWYELINGSYIETTDERVNPNKTYYRFITEHKTYFINTVGSFNEGNFRAYMDACYNLYESTGNRFSGIPAHIDEIPKENQDKVRETQITAATVLQAFCQINGVFGIVDGYGRFDYVKLNISNPVDIEEIYQIEVGHSDIEFPKITSVIIFDKTSEEYSSDNIHTDYGDVKNGQKGSALAYYPSDRDKVQGDTANPLTVEDNFLMNSFNQSDAMNTARNLYNQVSNLTMRNCDITIKAMPWLNIGTGICFYAPTDNTLYPADNLYPSDNLYPMDYEKITTLIMSYEISGTGLLKQKIETKVEDLQADIVQINEVITDELFQRKIGTDRLYSSFLQTAEKIESQVVDLDRGLSSRITQLSNLIEMEVKGPGGALSRIAISEKEIQLQSERITNECVNFSVYAADKIELNGRLTSIESDQVYIKANAVTFEDLQTGGKTVIEGSNIKTGTITADQIKSNSISCDRLQMGRVSLDGQTYTMGWHKVMLYDTKHMTTMHKLGLTVKPSDMSVTIGIKVTRDPNTGYVTDVAFAKNPTGTGWTTVAVIAPENLITDLSSGGVYAYGPVDREYSNELVCYERSTESGSGTSYRLIMASENRAY